MNADTKIETVHQTEGEQIRRFEVPGGWLYEWQSVVGAHPPRVAFVPSVPSGSDAPIHVCEHGLRGNSCGICGAMWASWHR